LLKSVLDKFFPDKSEQERQQLAAALTIVQGQLTINQEEARSVGIFKGGWRPFIGWICGIGLAFQFLVAPLGTWIVTLAGYPIPFPELDLGTLLTLLAGMLGLGTLRTQEKIKGVTK
jgi:hypothetical protein